VLVRYYGKKEIFEADCAWTQTAEKEVAEAERQPKQDAEAKGRKAGHASGREQVVKSVARAASFGTWRVFRAQHQRLEAGGRAHARNKDIRCSQQKEERGDCKAGQRYET